MTDARCSMGVGCDEAGVCYAEANGQPDACPLNARPQPEAPASASDLETRLRATSCVQIDPERQAIRPNNPDGPEAADALASQDAEIARLERVVVEAREALTAALQRADDSRNMRISILRLAVCDAIKALATNQEGSTDATG